ncbi:hypothetical protein E0H75_05905 [Kribbella capetownensis]|uniref:DUF624 domain-containing protein n=1 Tax=Kribbella capetownensis TaxID=1572659 RepID=A0A4R0K5N1_9ACTN|nr:hypothetical protein [Kribbella capetownensis]TCC53246.1 hypothetical protein E0H75_05905 [Kribbella capetownensis]
MTDHLPAAFRALWHELPLLAAAGVMVCTTSGVVVLLSPGLSPVSVLLGALLIGPVWAAVVATADSVVRDDRGGVLLLLRNLRRHWLAGLEVALVPGVIAALAVLNQAIYTGPIFAIPLAVSGCATVLALLASCYAFSLRVTAGLRGKTLWLTALHLVARAPLVPLGVLALAFVALLLGTSVTASLLLLAPGPVALFASAGTWTENHALHR